MGSGRTGAHSASAQQLPFRSPVTNGMDYLESVIGHLAVAQPTPRDLKYAILHLHAATEVLLKAALMQEHWSLVFTHPGAAQRQALDDGTLSSCSVSEAISRLRGIAGVQIQERDVTELTKLGEWRNGLQHFGITAAAPAVESRAARVLDFLLTFIRTHLIERLGSAEKADVEATLETVWQRVGEIKKYVQQRMNVLRKDLESLKDVTVQCPECKQWAFAASPEHEERHCLFCGWAVESPGEAADHYAWAILGLDEYRMGKDGEAWPVADCPECYQYGLLYPVTTACAPDSRVYFCFACGYSTDQLVECDNGCGQMLHPDDFQMCSGCREIVYGDGTA